jgi:hypothetical protein
MNDKTHQTEIDPTDIKPTPFPISPTSSLKVNNDDQVCFSQKKKESMIALFLKYNKHIGSAHLTCRKYHL